MSMVTVLGRETRAALSRWRTVSEPAHDHDADFLDRLNIQFEGARRFDRRFAITVAPVRSEDLATVLGACARNLRLLDAVTSLDDDVMFLWAETAHAGAAAATTRLVEAGFLPIAAKPRHAVFPDDGYTTTALIDAATAPAPEVDRARADWAWGDGDAHATSAARTPTLLGQVAAGR